MTHLLVGDPDCSSEEIALIFNEPSIITLKINWWTTLAMYLGIPSDSVTNWQNDLLIGKLKHIDVIRGLLEKWREQKSKDATLGAFYAKIPDDQKQLKDFVQAKIREKAKCWKDLDPDSQKLVMQTNFNFLGQNYSLSSIRAMMTEDKFEEVLNKPEMKEHFSKSFGKEYWNLGHYDIPKTLPYYIQRKLTLKRQLNSDIFKHNCLDIFLIEGIQHHHLSFLVKPESTDISSDQRDKVTRRFILLEHPDDYSEIIKVAMYPVHRIKHEDNQFFWLSTSGSCQTIRVYLKNDAEEFDEICLLKDQLSTCNNRPIAICSSPGMGKSVLLANMAQEMINTYPNRITIYLEFRFLLALLSSISPYFDMKHAHHILVATSSISSIGKEFLSQFLNNKDLFFEVFLDGLDEIQLDRLSQAKRFLKCLLGSPNVRIYITSRPHMKIEIENTLEVISLDIAPFNSENQINFLCDLWNWNYNITNREKLSSFALKVLESLEFINQNTTSEAEFTGIPLQCLMLAQVYANDAKMYCNRDKFHFKATGSTLFKLYQEFMNLKFKNIQIVIGT